MVMAELAAEVPVEEEERRQALEAFLREKGLEGPEALQAFLRVNLLRQEELEDQVVQPLRLQRYVARHHLPKAEARFLQRKTQLDRVVYSLLRLEDAGLARELYLQLEAGEADFAELAAAHSEGPEQQTRGIVGPVPLTQAHPQLSERLRTTQVGTLMEPFQIAEWWLVARLESYAPAVFDDAMAEQMARELLEQWVQEETLRILGELTAPAALTPLLSSPA